jgi:hypothetical protein
LPVSIPLFIDLKVDIVSRVLRKLHVGFCESLVHIGNLYFIYVIFTLAIYSTA